MAVTTHHHDILNQYWKGPIDLFGLWNICYEVLGQSLFHIQTKDFDRALRGGNKAHNCLE